MLSQSIKGNENQLEKKKNENNSTKHLKPENGPKTGSRRKTIAVADAVAVAEVTKKRNKAAAKTETAAEAFFRFSFLFFHYFKLHFWSLLFFTVTGPKAREASAFRAFMMHFLLIHINCQKNSSNTEKVIKT